MDQGRLVKGCSGRGKHPYRSRVPTTLTCKPMCSSQDHYQLHINREQAFIERAAWQALPCRSTHTPATAVRAFATSGVQTNIVRFAHRQFGNHFMVALESFYGRTGITLWSN